MWKCLERKGGSVELLKAEAGVDGGGQGHEGAGTLRTGVEASFCLCAENLSEGEHTRNGLIRLVEEVSRWGVVALHQLRP